MFELSPEEFNLGLAKPFISSVFGHAASHARSMPILTNGLMPVISTRIFVSGL